MKRKMSARRANRGRAEATREVIDALPDPADDFAVIGSFEGDSSSVVDIPKKDLLRGFGEDSLPTWRGRRTT